MEPMKTIIEIALVCLGLLVALPALAERADREKPINVEADSVKVDDMKRVAVYEGHVVMTQGTLMINANRVDIQQDAKGVVTGFATGKPVYFRQKMDASNELAEGWADNVEYDGQAGTIKLMGQARLKRGIDELRGEQITYDSNTEFFQAKGSTNGGNGRVRAVLRPRPVEGATTTPTAPATPTTPTPTAPAAKP